MHSQGIEALKNFFRAQCIRRTSQDPDFSVTAKHSDLKCTFNFFYVLVKLAEKFPLALCRDGQSRFNHTHLAVIPPSRPILQLF